jgi:alpha-glucoside transport system substrate-binding protein
MRAFQRRRYTAPLALAAITGLALVGCTTSNTPSTNAPSSGAHATVNFYGPDTGTEATELEASWAAWSKANNITINYSGDANFAQNIATKIQGNSLPDIAMFPQPGLLTAAIQSGKIVKSDAVTKANVKKNFSSSWSDYVTHDGSLYGTPLDANVKGYIWYSPTQFKNWGITVPKTWSDLLADTKTIQAKTGKPPWCAGFNSAQASGWPGADWLADLVLRQSGASTYQSWVSGKTPFTSAKIGSAFEDLGQILLNPKYVNAGFGGVPSINSTAFGDVAAPLANGTCAMTHQANFLEASFATVKTAAGGTPTVGPTGDIWAFMLPPIHTGGGQQVTGGGDFAAAFNTNAATTKVMNYLSSAAWANKLVSVKDASFISANKGVDVANVSDPLLKSATKTLQDPNTVFQFGADDQMPETVETAFWKGMVDWINGTSTSAVQTQIQASWANNG